MATRTLSGGAGLSKALGDLAKRMKSGTLSVGFMSGATYTESGTPIAAVAFWNEYGKPEQGQPPRPFFRNMIAKESPNWGKTAAALAKAFNYDTSTVLRQMGEDIEDALQKSIIDTNEPPLSPITLMLRKHYWGKRKEITGATLAEAARRVAEGETGATGTQAKPLIWTAQMLNAVTFRVD